MSDSKDPGSNISFLKDEINRLFRDIFSEDRFFDRIHFPVIDIIENEDTLRLVIEVPGVEKDDIKVEIYGDSLIIEGSKRDPEESDRISYVCMERRFGHFRRIVPLPSLGSVSDVKTRHENGILTIILPKKTERRESVKIIEIE